MENHRDTRTALLLAALVLATRIPFVYQAGMGEPDSVAMAAGMAKGMTTAADIGDTFVYGRQVSAGMYLFTGFVYPKLFADPRHLIAFLNWLSVASFALMMWPLYALFRRSMPAHAAALAVLLAAFSPLIWESSTYFHPLVPASLLLLVSLVCARRIGRSTRGIAFLALTAIAASAAFLIRTEVIFVVPALLVGPLLSKRKLRNTVLACGLGAWTALAYVAVQRLLPGAVETSTHNIASYVRMMWELYSVGFSIPGLTRSVTWAVLGIGVGGLAAAAWGLLVWFRRRPVGGGELITALVWVLPAVLFWLPQPTPILRHYFLSTFGVAWLVGALVLSRLSARRAAAVAAAVALASIVIPEAAYRSYNATHPESAKEPHGAFFYYHGRTGARIARYRGLARDLVAAVRNTPPGAAVQVGWEGYAYVLDEMYTDTRGAARLSRVRDNPNVTYDRYSFEGGELRLIQAIRLTEGAPPTVIVRDLVTRAHAEGFRVFLPAEVGAVGLSSDGLGFDVTTY